MKRLPIFVSTFPKMIEGDYVYIDKTQQIYNLFADGGYYFLSRPRRFGKSLLISTLHELFSGNKELFKDLWIAKSDYKWTEHPVINLDFSDLDIGSPEELRIGLASSLDDIASNYSIDISSKDTPGLKLKTLIKVLAQKNKVAVLIDEYDYPLINNLDDPKTSKANNKILKNFFSVLKSLNAYIHSIVLTGVTKFSKTSVFSGLNNLNDITIDEKAAALLGYTKEEIEEYFPEFISEASIKLEMTTSEIKREMQQWYNGYRFSDLSVYVYNPFSVLYFLEKKKFSNYWIESGNPSFFIELIKNQYKALENFESIQFSYDSLGTFDIGRIPIIALLFQTGYLTIESYDTNTRRYRLDYPSFEIKESFQKYILAAISNNNVSDIDDIAYELSDALSNNKVPLFCTLLQSLLANIPYQLHISEERYYHSLFQLIGNLLRFNIQSEISTDKGRIDLVITTQTNIFIFELKFGLNAKAALQQIIDTKYYERYLGSKKEIILIGLSFNNKKKKLFLTHEFIPLANVLK